MSGLVHVSRVVDGVEEHDVYDPISGRSISWKGPKRSRFFEWLARLVTAGSARFR